MQLSFQHFFIVPLAYLLIFMKIQSLVSELQSRTLKVGVGVSLVKLDSIALFVSVSLAIPLGQLRQK